MPLVLVVSSFALCPTFIPVCVYCMHSPRFWLQVIDQLLPDLSAAERAIAAAPGMAGRIWFGQGMVYDEMYAILMDLGILTDPKVNTRKGSNTSGQNTNQGWFNKFLQTGRSDHETKTNGCFGGLEAGLPECPCIS